MLCYAQETKTWSVESLLTTPFSLKIFEEMVKITKNSEGQLQFWIWHKKQKAEEVVSMHEFQY